MAYNTNMNAKDRIKKLYTDKEFSRIMDRAITLHNEDKDKYDEDVLLSTAGELDIPERYLTSAIKSLKTDKIIKEKFRKSFIIAGTGALVFILLAVILVWNNSRPQDHDYQLKRMRDKYYNSLVALDEDVKAKMAQMENVIARRFTLIPQLASIAESSANFEKDIADNLSEIAINFKKAFDFKEKVKALNDLNSQIARFTQVMENIGSLKSGELYSKLMFEIAGSENRISVERKRYNEAVNSYNKLTRSYPLNNYVEELGFPKAKPYFKSEGNNFKLTTEVLP